MEGRHLGGQAPSSDDSVSEFEAGKRIIDGAIDTFGRIVRVVNNVGILRDTIFRKMSEQDFDSVLAVRLKGSFNTSTTLRRSSRTRAAAPLCT